MPARGNSANLLHIIYLNDRITDRLPCKCLKRGSWEKNLDYSKLNVPLRPLNRLDAEDDASLIAQEFLI